MAKNIAETSTKNLFVFLFILNLKIKIDIDKIGLIKYMYLTYTLSTSFYTIK